LKREILFECKRDMAGLYLEDPTPEGKGLHYEMPVKFWKMLIKRYKEISEDHNFTPEQRANAKNLMGIIREELEEINKLTVIRVIKSYTGEDGWGYDCVEASNGNNYHVRQEPDNNWKVGDDITKAEKTIGRII